MRLIAIVTTLTPALLSAQGLLPAPTRWDVTLGNGSGLTSASVGLVRTRDLLSGNRLRVGLGLRSTFVGGPVELTPAGAVNVPAGVVDTLQLDAAALLLNVSGHFSLVLTRRLEAGLNIDLAGVGFGSSRAASYRARPGGSATSEQASPSSANLFLYGSKDRGSLNSEFFGAWAATDRLTIRGGLSHQLVEYRADRKLTSNTDRFRQYANLLFVGARIRQ